MFIFQSKKKKKIINVLNMVQYKLIDCLMKVREGICHPKGFKLLKLAKFKQSKRICARQRYRYLPRAGHSDLEIGL